MSPTRRPRRSLRPTLEALDSRDLPSSLVVVGPHRAAHVRAHRVVHHAARAHAAAAVHYAQLRAGLDATSLQILHGAPASSSTTTGTSSPTSPTIIISVPGSTNLSPAATTPTATTTTTTTTAGGVHTPSVTPTLGQGGAATPIGVLPDGETVLVR